MAFTFDENEVSERISLLTMGLMSNLDRDAPRINEDSMEHIHRSLVPGMALLDNPTPKKQPQPEGEASESESGDENPVDEDEEETDSEFSEPGVLAFLQSLNPDISAMCNVPSDELAIPGLKQNIRPFSHQTRAARVIMRAVESKFKGIIIGDPPGLGKTLTALMAIAATPSQGYGPSVIIAPSSCCQQWVREIESFFEKDSMKVLHLSGDPVSPVELFRYDIVVASYHYVASELGRASKYLAGCEDFKAGDTSRLPKRPSVTLLSDVFQNDDGPTLGKFLVLDEAHSIKNYGSRIYASIQVLREFFDGCVMLSGTPLDNTWLDSYALLSMLRGHSLTSPLRMRLAFTDFYDKNSRAAPKGHYMTRIIQLLDAVTLRRPASIVSDFLPPITRKMLVITLSEQDLDNSNDAFADWKNSVSGDKNKKKKRFSFRPTKIEASANWAALVKAQQHANHPKLVEIMKYEKDSLVAPLRNDMALGDAQEEEDEEEIGNWRSVLRENENYRSARVDAVEDIINQHRDRRPDDALLVMDESVFFLDILEIAISFMDPPVPCYRYDGRQGPAERHLTMERFRAAVGCRVLLASRGTGGQGLNVQCANALIRCGPWWKASWGEQAEGRTYRAGQTKPVFIYDIRAAECDYEVSKAETRDRKNRTNTAIMNAVTRIDGAQAPERSCI